MRVSWEASLHMGETQGQSYRYWIVEFFAVSRVWDPGSWKRLNLRTHNTRTPAPMNACPSQPPQLNYYLGGRSLRIDVIMVTCSNHTATPNRSKSKELVAQYLPAFPFHTLYSLYCYLRESQANLYQIVNMPVRIMYSVWLSYYAVGVMVY